MSTMHNHVKTELCRYEEAAWAPLLPGADWAWRVSRPSGDSITGACKGKKSEAQRKVNAIAKRMKKMASGVGSYGSFKIKNEG